MSKWLSSKNYNIKDWNQLPTSVAEINNNETFQTELNNDLLIVIDDAKKFPF